MQTAHHIIDTKMYADYSVGVKCKLQTMTVVKNCRLRIKAVFKYLITCQINFFNSLPSVKWRTFVKALFYHEALGG